MERQRLLCKYLLTDDEEVSHDVQFVDVNEQVRQGVWHDTHWFPLGTVPGTKHSRKQRWVEVSSK